MRRADIKRQNTSVLIINASCLLRVKSKRSRPLPPSPPPPPPRDNVVKKGRKKERKERERERGKTATEERKGGESKEREKLEQTKRGDRAATYLGAALQKQERPTRQLGNDPAL